MNRADQNAAVQKALAIGGKRFRRVIRHQEDARQFILRQRQHALVAALELFAFVLSSAPFGRAVFILCAMLCIQAGSVEARRFRACGIYYQCNRSVEVVGI